MFLAVATKRVLLGLMLTVACFVGGTARAEVDEANMLKQLRELNSQWNLFQPDFAALPSQWQANDETTLIQTHLRLVIDQLQQANVADLSAEQFAQRAEHLATLEAYMLKGEFPQNTIAEGRQPVFIDPWGTHCAVGYLIAASGNEALARQIDAEHHLDYLGDIATEGLVAWQVSSGLSMTELALIQPSYHYREINYPSEIEDLILGDSTEIRRAVEENPDLVNARCGGKTLLHFAAAAGDLPLCKFLVEQGADINAVSKLAREPVAPVEKKPGHPVIRISSSSTIYDVRWNAATKVSRGGGGGLRMGRGGRAFSSNRGSLIANMFDDMRGGSEGKTALHFATRRVGLVTWSNKKPADYVVKLNEDRASVASWLQEQGAT